MKIYHDPTNMTPGAPLSVPGGAMADAFNAFTEKDRQEFQRAYYAGVSFMDAQVGRLLDTLDRLHLWTNTVVIFSGDNGYHHNERKWWNKSTLFERSCRVPLMIATPDARRGAVCKSLVEFVDLYPTVAEYCGVKPPHALAGTSLRALLKNPARPGKDAAFTLVTRGQNRYGQAVRTERWRYVQWSDGNSELYDETNDPEETHDLHNDPAQEKTIQQLKGLLTRVGPFKPVKPAKT
jgi:uncharacterized sulfatase